MSKPNTKPQLFVLDTEIGPRIQMILAKDQMNGRSRYKNMSDYVNKAIHEKLRKDEKI